MKKIVGTLAAVAAVAIGATASATVARFLDLEEHVAASDLVIRARTGEKVETFLGADGRPRTETPFHVLQTFKGEARAGSVVRVRQLGGELPDGGRLVVPGDAAFAPNEEVVLFLVTDPDGTAFLTAMGQSKYSVRPGPGGPMVERNLDGIAFYLGGADAKIVPGAAEAPVDLPLFSRAIRDAVTLEGKIE
ncbi:MAG TPA: hypothetical protein VN033_04845 [Vulgatibacter sp.]|nr:hypothetical protein [Vulgatibacter sp.]